MHSVYLVSYYARNAFTSEYDCFVHFGYYARSFRGGISNFAIIYFTLLGIYHRNTERIHLNDGGRITLFLLSPLATFSFVAGGATCPLYPHA